MVEKVRVDEVRIAGRDSFVDLNTVRTAVRTYLYGRSAPAGAVVDVISPSGEVETWEFGPEVGYPTNIDRDFMRDWVDACTQ